MIPRPRRRASARRRVGPVGLPLATVAVLGSLIPCAAWAAPHAPAQGPGQTSAQTSGTSAVRATVASAATPSRSPVRRAEGDDVDPIAVVLDSVSPAAIPAKGAVTVTGRLVNTSDEAWSDLKVYLLTSSTPIRTDDELDAALATDPRSEVGERLVDDGLFQRLPALAAGQSLRYRLRVPVASLDISGEPGVYWLGVQVLATDSTGQRLDGADGRARTFIPLVSPDTLPTQLGLGIQFRNHTVRAYDGTLEFLPGWQQTLSPGGRLRRVLELAEAGQGRFPLTWVVDPAVVEAAESVASGNPALDLAPSATPPDGDTGTDPGSDPSTDTASGGDTGGDAQPDPEEEPSSDSTADEQAAASAWVSDFARSGASRGVLALPYGDVDAAAAARSDHPDITARGLKVSADVLDRLGLNGIPALVPRAGALPREAFTTLDPEVPAALSAAGAPEGSPVLRTVSHGNEVLLLDADAASGGPDGQSDALAVRQRLLAEAALHALSEDRDVPLLALLPVSWDPGARWRSARLFAGLDQPWLQPVELADVLGGISTEPPLEPGTDLRYTPGQERRELPRYAMEAASAVLTVARTLGDLVTGTPALDDRVARQGLLAASSFSRIRPGLAAERARDTETLVNSWFDKITVRGPSFVTMSAEEGTFSVTLVNGLDQPVTVGLQAAVSGGNLDLRLPPPVVLGPGRRTLVRVDATSTGIGVHQVQLQPVTAGGATVGEGLTLSVRTSNVGLVLWLIMGGGAALLLGAILVRLVRRARRRRRTHGPVLARGNDQHPTDEGGR